MCPSWPTQVDQRRGDRSVEVEEAEEAEEAVDAPEVERPASLRPWEDSPFRKVRREDSAKILLIDQIPTGFLLGSLTGAEMQGRCKTDAGQMQDRCRADAGQMQGRCRVDAG